MDPTSTASSVSKPPLPFLFDPNHFDSRYTFIDTPPSTIGRVTTHYHVDTFVDSINNAIAVYGSAFVKDNIHHCLRGDAFRWYSTLAKLNKDAIQNDPSPSLYQWIGRLQEKFHSRKPLPEPPSRFAPTPARTQNACPIHAKRGQTYYHPAESCRLVGKKPMTQPPPLYSPQEVKALVSTIITELSARIVATSSSPESPSSLKSISISQPTPSSPPSVVPQPPKSRDTTPPTVTAPTSIPSIRWSSASVRKADLGTPKSSLPLTPTSSLSVLASDRTSDRS